MLNVIKETFAPEKWFEQHLDCTNASSTIVAMQQFYHLEVCSVEEVLANSYMWTGQAYFNSFDTFKLNIPSTMLSYLRLPQQCQKPLKCLSLINFKWEWITGTDIADLSITECVKLGPHHVCIPISPACDPHQPRSPTPSGNATLIQNKLPANLLHKNVIVIIVEKLSSPAQPECITKQNWGNNIVSVTSSDVRLIMIWLTGKSPYKPNDLQWCLRRALKCL